MARVKVSIMEVEGVADHASGFDGASLEEAADRAVAWLIGQVRRGVTLEKTAAATSTPAEADATGGASTPDISPTASKSPRSRRRLAE